jgi:hypothetical protein
MELDKIWKKKKVLFRVTTQIQMSYPAPRKTNPLHVYHQGRRVIFYIYKTVPPDLPSSFLTLERSKIEFNFFLTDSGGNLIIFLQLCWFSGMQALSGIYTITLQEDLQQLGL